MKITIALLNQLAMAVGLSQAALGQATLIDSSAKFSPDIIKSNRNAGDPTAERLRAKKIYERLSGVRVHIDNPKLDQMEILIAGGDLQGAAEIATAQPTFINSTVRSFAAKMSSREETIRAPLSDFVATIMGIAKDNLDARTMLTGNFLYQADANKITTRSNVANDLIKSNNHYEDLDSFNFDVGKLLVRTSSQQILPNDANGNLNLAGTPINHPDPAGILTSRAWMMAHADAGTNRRLFEYTLREFLCMPLSAAADTNASDLRIGRDIDRFPGGDHNVFETSCKGCHTVQDGFRGAFAKFDFVNDTPFYKINGIQNKLNSNAGVFSAGFASTDDTFLNNATSKKNLNLFKWRGNVAQGRGVGQFATMISNTSRYSLCMAQRAMELVCRKTPTEADLNTWLNQLSNEFEQNNYNLKKLFQRVAINQNCIGG